LWQFYQKKIAECDQAIQEALQVLAGPEDPKNPAPPATKRGGVNAPQIAGLHGLLWRLCGGKDPTQLPGVADYVLLQLLGEAAPTWAKTGRPKSTSRLGWGWRRAVETVANAEAASAVRAIGLDACFA
jgi:hypothetical protein